MAPLPAPLVNPLARRILRGVRLDVPLQIGCRRSASRPGWDDCLAALKPGDTLYVTKLDRIGRSLVNLVDVVTTLAARGVGIRSLDQGDIDTTTPHGKLLFQIMAALAEWEAAITRERTR